jgi:hypothetical protein
MLRQLTAAPVALDEPHLAYEPIAIPRFAPRWGPPIWAADEPIATLDHPPVGQVDLIVMSVMLSHRPG